MIIPIKDELGNLKTMLSSIEDAKKYTKVYGGFYEEVEE